MGILFWLTGSSFVQQAIHDSPALSVQNTSWVIEKKLCEDPMCWLSQWQQVVSHHH